MPTADAPSFDISELKFAPFNRVPLWCPRIWNGMNMRAWGSLIGENRYRFSPSRVPSAIIASCTTVLPTLCEPLQRWLYGAQIEALPLAGDPLFVIGHWRTGTTWLHELLADDPRFATPTTFHCFFPNAFLVTRSWLRPLTSILIPPKRPMDDMGMGWDVPQEDEFAYLSMGLPTPYRRIAFPNEIPRHMDYLNMHGIPHREREAWKTAVRGFIKNLNFAFRRPVVLKSPPHTGRMGILREIFPAAKFVHITRHPEEFIPSTIRLWAALDSYNGMQVPHHHDLVEYVFSSFERLYRGFFRDEGLCGDSSHIHVRYEDLLTDTAGSLARVYECLELPGAEEIPARLDARKETTTVRKGTKYTLPVALREMIHDRCGEYMRRFGYAESPFGQSGGA